MKLDFTKAYNTISWEFMFQAMDIIGVHPSLPVQSNLDNVTLVNRAP